MIRAFVSTIIVLFGILEFSNGQNLPDKSFVEVTGIGNIEIEPDMIYLSVIVSEKDNKGKASLAELEVAMFSKLKALGIDLKKDLKVKELTSNFKERTILGNEIILSKAYQLLTKDGKSAGAVVVALESIGISNVRIEKTTHSNLEQIKKEVRVKAMRSAQENADAMAKAIGQEIGKAYQIQEQYCNIITSPIPALRAMKSFAGNFDTESAQEDIDFEKIKIDCSLIVRFELK